jgi:glycerol-3-phosphate dehydrogenase
MRSRDLTRFAATPYDLLVIGGGIHGLAIAYEGASRGLRTALIDSGDFGAATSFNHQKTVHGGLRSLQSGSLRRARTCVLERRAFARMAPWLLRPLPFLVGTHRSVSRGRLAIRAAFKLESWLARDRNTAVEPELHLPAPRLVSKAATLRLFPGVRQDKLTGAAQWYDYQMVEGDRLTFAFAVAADRAGADLANYVEAVSPLRDGQRVTGFTAKNVLTGATLTIPARVTVNAAGAHVGTIMASFGVTRAVPLVKAMNLVTSRRASDIALAAPTSRGRMLTLVPWRGYALIGTMQGPAVARPDDTRIRSSELAACIADANDAFPALKLTADDVRLVHRGLVPAVETGNGGVDLRPWPAIHDHASDGAPGAVTVIGVKYSTARRVAEDTLAIVARRLGKRLPPSRTALTTLPGAGIADHEALAIETARTLGLDLPIAVIRHLIGRYAERGADIVRLMHEREALAAPIADNVPTLGAEVVHAIQYEMAQHLSDIVIRRTGLGNAGHPGAAAVRACAEIAARELDWDQEHVVEEIAGVDRFYSIGD